MKRINAFAMIGIFFISPFSTSCAQEDLKSRLVMDLTSYDQREIEKSEYTYSDNWNNFIQPGMKLKIAYKLVKPDETQSTSYITEIIYFIEQKENKIILGRITITNGFQDGFGKQFIADKNLFTDSDFMRNSLIGFSTDCIKNPFFIRGIARMKDTSVPYKTEVLTRIEIDNIRLTIIEHLTDI